MAQLFATSPNPANTILVSCMQNHVAQCHVITATITNQSSNSDSVYASLHNKLTIITQPIYDMDNFSESHRTVGAITDCQKIVSQNTPACMLISAGALLSWARQQLLLTSEILGDGFAPLVSSSSVSSLYLPHAAIARGVTPCTHSDHKLQVHQISKF